MKKRIIAASCIALATLIALGIVYLLARSTPDEIRVGYMRISAHLPVIAADKEGIFDKHKLRVRLEHFSNTPNLMKALEIGRIDVAYQVTPDIAWASRAQGHEFQIYFIAQSTKKSPIDGLYARGPLTADDIRGKIVGHFPGPTASAMVKRVLKREYGLDPADYELRSVSPVLQQTQLKSGEIVALFTYEPLGTLLIERIGATKVLSAPVEEHIVNPWNGGIGLLSEDLVTRRPSVATAFQRAIMDSVAKLEADKDLAARMTVDLMPGMDRETAKKVPTVAYVFSSDDRGNESLYESLQKQLAVYQSLGIMSANLDNNIQIFRP